MPSNAAPTCGWDTVFAVPIARVNQAIIAHNSSPPTLDYTDPDTKFHVHGDFGAWQITTGGDGGLVKLSVPINNFVATNASGAKWTTPALQANVEVRLQYFTSTEDTTIPSNEHHLRVRASTSNPDNDPVASVQVNWEKDIPPGNLRFGSEDGIQDWCDANLGTFEHVFAVATLNDEVDTGKWSFVKPRVVSYAYAEQDGGLNPLLAVLAMTKTSTGPVPTDQQVSNFVIPSGAQAGFLISPERMLMDLLCPKFSLVWPNCDPTDFEYAADMLQLKQGRGFDLPSFTYEGLTYTPHMETLFVSIHEQTLQIDSFTTVPVSPGITATCRSTLTYSIGLASNQNGQTLSFSELPNQPTPIHDIVYADSVTDAQKTINTISVWGAVISILLAPETLGLSLLVGGLVFGLLAGLTDGTLDEIEKYHLDDAPAIDMLTIQAVTPFQWTDSKDFQLTSAALNTSLQLGGTWNG